LRAVLRMNRVEDGPTVQCLKSFAKIFQHLPIDEFGRTCPFGKLA